MKNMKKRIAQMRKQLAVKCPSVNGLMRENARLRKGTKKGEELGEDWHHHRKHEKVWHQLSERRLDDSDYEEKLDADERGWPRRSAAPRDHHENLPKLSYSETLNAASVDASVMSEDLEGGATPHI